MSPVACPCSWQMRQVANLSVSACLQLWCGHQIHQLHWPGCSALQCSGSLRARPLGEPHSTVQDCRSDADLQQIRFTRQSIGQLKLIELSKSPDYCDHTISSIAPWMVVRSVMVYILEPEITHCLQDRMQSVDRVRTMTKGLGKCIPPCAERESWVPRSSTDPTKKAKRFRQRQDHAVEAS